MDVSRIVSGVIDEIMAQGADSKDFQNSDGLICCGICGMPKQCRKTWLDGKDHLLPIMCACMELQMEQEREAERIRKFRELLKYRRDIAFPAERYWEYTFDHDDHKLEDISRTCRAYAGKFQEILDNNLGLAFCGDSGNGKTFFASMIANELLDSGYRVWLTTIPDLTARLNANYGEHRDEVLKRIRSTDLFVLDDFGAERDTTFQSEKVFEIIDTRYQSGKPLILTTNISKAEMAHGEHGLREARIYSRLQEMISGFIQVPKVDRRRARNLEKRQELWRTLSNVDGAE